MVRTRAEGTVKVAAAKAPRKVFSSSSGGSSSSSASSSSTTPSKGSKYSGGNSYKPQPVPEWQKGITSFFKPLEEDRQRGRAEEVQGSSMQAGEGSGVRGGVCDMEEGEGSGLRSASSPSPLPKNGMISDDDD